MSEPEYAVSDLSEFRHRAAHREAEVYRPRALPAGTVTFLLTDIEGSTRRWEDHGPAMSKAVARHYEILAAAVAGHGGVRPVEQGEGDSMVAAFARASDAAAAALEAQRALMEEAWPDGAALAVRMALHTGEAQIRDELFYEGTSIIRCARLRALAHGGQVVISNTTADLLADGLSDGAALLPLGVHRLRDLRQPERIFQLAHPALPAHFPLLRSLEALPNNLPAQLTSFVGREKELAELGQLLAQHRLVTLVGTGGCGKTRLAVQVAAELAEEYPDGVWWVDLAPLTDPDLVTRAVAGALGLLDNRSQGPLERITDYLDDQRVLLVLDNCEHVLSTTSLLVDGTLRRCPNVVALATSRESLGIPGEVAWRVPPLSLPPQPGHEQSTEGLLASESVRLFVERAGEARPTFRIDGDSGPAIASICSRLDGIPLAIELAAARVRSLSPERILDGLVNRFRLLTGGARTAAGRQQTLQASVEWSHDLLNDAERMLFRRLAVFSGSFSLKAVEEVCAGGPLESWEILTLLSDLVEKSLVVFDGDRYRLLQTIHDFARGQLLAAGEADTLRDGHAAHYLPVAEASAVQLGEALRLEILESLEADHDNLRAALQWLLDREDTDAALRLVGALAIFWATHGHYSEARDWYRKVLSVAPADTSAVRARALWGLGHLSLLSMDYDGGYGTADTMQAATLAGQLGDHLLLGRTLADQGVLMAFAVPEAGIATLEQAVEAARQAEDDWTLATAVTFLAFHWIFQRDRIDLADPLLDELAGIVARTDSLYWRTWHSLIVGIARGRRGRLGEARTALEDALDSSWKLADPMLESWSAAFLTEAQICGGDYDEADSVAARSLAWQCRSAFCRAEWVQSRLAIAALARGDCAEVRRQLEAVSPVLRQCGIPFIVETLGVLAGRVALEEGDLPAARAALDEALAVATNLAAPWLLAEVHNARGRLCRAEGDPATAEDLHHEALGLCVEYGFRGVATETLEALASLAVGGESGTEATRLFGAASALRDSTGQARWPLDQPAYDTDIARLQASLSYETFEKARHEGLALSLEEAAAYASRARGERKRPSLGWAALTPTEVEVVALATQGLTNAAIGSKLFITAGTAKVHLSNIYRKLGVANRAQLAAQATARGVGGS